MNRTPLYVIGLSNWDQVKFNGTPGVIIDQSLVDKFGYKIGSNITIKGKDFTVTGITKESTGMGMGLVFLDVDKAVPLNDNKVTSISASARGDPETVKRSGKSGFRGHRHDQIRLHQTDRRPYEWPHAFHRAIASIGLIVGVISIVNIMLVNVTERTREIGVLKAIGFTNREVLGSILMEAGLLGFIGAIIGLIIAAILLQLGIILFGAQLGMEDVSLAQMLPAWLVLAVVGGATLLSVLAGLYPAWRASRLNVVEALRYD